MLEIVSSPDISFITSSFEEFTVSLMFRSYFEVAENDYTDLIFRIVFPFDIDNSMFVEWAFIDDTCSDADDTYTTYSTPSPISNDAGGAHFVVLEGASYSPGQIYQIDFTVTEMPSKKGFFDPVQASIVSSIEENFITYASNRLVYAFHMDDENDNDFTFSLSPTEDEDEGYFSLSFTAKADVKVEEDEISRIMMKLTNEDYTFAADAEGTCSTEYDLEEEIYPLNSDTYYCQFETTDYRTMSFVWNEGEYIPVGTKFRVSFKVQNPDLPSSTGLKIALMRKNGPIVRQYKKIEKAFECGAIKIESWYPKLYLGPNLDTTSSLFPELPLFSAGTSKYAIIFNSIRIDFQVSEGLPEPSSSYTVYVSIGGNPATVLPENLIYTSMPAADDQRIEYDIDTSTRDITITGIGELTKLKTYSIGFKLGLDGSENFSWSGSGSFGGIQIADSSGLDVVSYTALSDVPSSIKTIETNGQPTSSDYPTFIHAVTEYSDKSTFTSIDSTTNYGIKTDGPYNFFLKSNFGPHSGYGSFSNTNTESVIEIITSSSIYAKSTVSGSWLSDYASDNCFVRDELGDLLSSEIEDCYYKYQNKGQSGSAYALFRMSPKSSSFWAQAATDEYYYGFRNVYIPYHNSLYMDDTDAKILDAYVNFYSSKGSLAISSTSFPTPDYSYLDNMLVVAFSAFSNTVIDFPNYFMDSSEELDGSSVPQFLRISGLLDGISTSLSQKIILFFHDLSPLFLDPENPYEIGCASSAAYPVRCYYLEGVYDRTCESSPSKTCSSYYARDRIEIHFSTETLSVATSQDVQVLIPMIFEANSATSFYFALGAATVHTSSYSQFPQLILFKPPDVALSPPSSYTAYADLFLTSAETLIESVNIPNAVTISNGGFNLPEVGSDENQELNFDCDKNDYDECDLGEWEYWSVTYCAEWNFMENSDFFIDNDEADSYMECVYDINYVYEDGVGDLIEKWCAWCPVWWDGDDNEYFDVTAFYAPPHLGLEWPEGTYGAISGRNSTYGLKKITNSAFLTDEAFRTNVVSGVSVDPDTFYNGYYSAKIEFEFTATNDIPSFGHVLIEGNDSLPFSFLDSPNYYCSIYSSTSKETIDCYASTTASSVVIYLGEDSVSFGELAITLYGILADNTGEVDAVAFSIITTNSDGIGSTHYIDESEGDDAVLSFAEYPNPLNVLGVSSVSFLFFEKRFPTTLSVKVQLGNGKKFYENDRLNLNLGYASYDFGDNVLWCIPKNADGQILTYFSACDISDLSSIKLYASQDTNYFRFYLHLENFLIPSYSDYNSDDLVSAKIETASSSGYSGAQETDEMADFPMFFKSPVMNSAEIYRKSNYYGSRAEFRVVFTPNVTSLEYTSILLVLFPSSYSPDLSSFPITCYTVEGEDEDTSEINCWIYSPRVLAISGFEISHSAGIEAEILIAGVQQVVPFVEDYEIFYLLLDSNSDGGGGSGLVSEHAEVNVTLPDDLSSVSKVYMEDIQFGINYIRTSTEITVYFRTDEEIPVSSLLLVYFDFLNYEFIAQDLSTSCSLKFNNGTDAAEDGGTQCTREGNRFKYLTSSTTSLEAETIYKLAISSVSTPDYVDCKPKRFQMSIVSQETGSLLFISTDYIYNYDEYSFGLDPTKKYATFASMTQSSPVSVYQALYNEISLTPDYTDSRFDDDISLSISYNPGSKFALNDSSEYLSFDSTVGLSEVPFLLAPDTSTIFASYPIRMTVESRFSSSFADLPLLRVKISPDKSPISVSKEEIIVYRGYYSLPVQIKLRSDKGLVPSNEELSFKVELLSYNPETKLSIKNGIYEFTLSWDSPMKEITIISSEELSTQPISDENARLKITPLDPSTPFDSVSIPITIEELWVETTSSFSMELTDETEYSFAMTFNTHMPATVHWYCLPEKEYTLISKKTIQSLLETGTESVGNLFFGKLSVESDGVGFTVGQDGDYGQDKIFQGVDYVFVAWWEGINLTEEALEELSVIVSRVSGTSSLSDGGTEYNAEIEGGIFLPGEESSILGSEASSLYSDSSSSSSDLSDSFTIIEVNGKVYSKVETVLSEDEVDGVLTITFETSLSEEQIENIVCAVARLCIHPLENVWGEKETRCPSSMGPEEFVFVSYDPHGSDAEKENNEVVSVPDKSSLDLAYTSSDLTFESISDVFNLRNLQASSSSSDSTEINTEFSLDVYFYANQKPYHEQLAIDRMIDLSEEDDFASNLSSLLNFTFPSVTSVSLITSSSESFPEFEVFPQVTTAYNQTYAEITSFTLKKAGVIYAIILETDTVDESLMSYQHIRYGVNTDLSSAIYSIKRTIEDPTTAAEEVLTYEDFEYEEGYTMYFYGQNQNPRALGEYTAVYKIDFTIGELSEYTFGRITLVSLCLLLLLNLVELL